MDTNKLIVTVIAYDESTDEFVIEKSSHPGHRLRIDAELFSHLTDQSDDPYEIIGNKYELMNTYSDDCRVL